MIVEMLTFSTSRGSRSDVSTLIAYVEGSFESVLRYQINAIFGRTTRESGNRVTLAIFKNSRALGSNLPALLEKSAAAQQRLPRCSPGWIHRPVAGCRAAIPGDAVVANGPAHQI